MSLSFCILGSGSAGNCSLIGFNGADQRRYALIDAGLSPRRTRKYLEALGLSLADISSILITHLDSDHFHRGWLRKIARGLTVEFHVHQRHRIAACRAGLTMRTARLFNGKVDLPCADVRIESVLLSHDDLGSVGFVIEHDGLRMGYATDLGCVPVALLKQFTGLHALAIESNYDRQMQMESLRPRFLKRRIMGGTGHLSNEQALDAVLHIEAQSSLSHLALLHLSRECNCPKKVRALYDARAPHLLDRLTISSQSKPTPMLRVEQIEPARRDPSHRRARSLHRQPTLFDAHWNEAALRSAAV